MGKKRKQLSIQIGLSKIGTIGESMLSQIGASLPRVVALEVVDSKQRINQVRANEDALKAEYIYEIESFPIKLKMSLSNGNKMEFELNRSGEWLIQGYLFSKIEQRLESRVRN